MRPRIARRIGHPSLAESFHPLRALGTGAAMKRASRVRAGERQLQRERPALFYDIRLFESFEGGRHSQWKFHPEFHRMLKRAEEFRTRIGKRIAFQRRHRDLADTIARAE